jgi:allantoicase
MAPLHLTIAYCNVKAFKALVALNGIDIDVRTYMGRTPLLLAIQACWTASDPSHREYFRRMSIHVSVVSKEIHLYKLTTY